MGAAQASWTDGESILCDRDKAMSNKTQIEKQYSLFCPCDTIVYREGCSLIASAKDPGLLNFDPITLERGAVSADSDLYKWSEDVADAATSTGLENPEFKRTVDLVIKNRAGGSEIIWRLFNAWPKRTSQGDRDSEASEKVIMSTVLEYDYAKRIKVCTSCLKAGKVTKRVKSSPVAAK